MKTYGKIERSLLTLKRSLRKFEFLNSYSVLLILLVLIIGSACKKDEPHEARFFKANAKGIVITGFDGKIYYQDYYFWINEMTVILLSDQSDEAHKSELENGGWYFPYYPVSETSIQNITNEVLSKDDTLREKERQTLKDFFSKHQSEYQFIGKWGYQILLFNQISNMYY